MHHNSQQFIQTYNGRRFYPFNPRPQDITFECLVHSASQIGRFGGHTMWFYPIAEHQMLVGLLMPKVYRLWGGTHDLAECIGGDMVRPLKHTDQMAPFRATEHRIQACMYQKFGLNIANEPYDLLKRADKMAVKLEMFTVLKGGPLPEMEAYVADVPMPGPEELGGFKIERRTPEDTKQRYAVWLAQEMMDYWDIHGEGVIPSNAHHT